MKNLKEITYEYYHNFSLSFFIIMIQIGFALVTCGSWYISVIGCVQISFGDSYAMNFLFWHRLFDVKS